MAGLIWLLMVSTGTAAVTDYDVRLSWFIDMAHFDDSAHNNLFCIDCHKSVVQQSQHPAPENITREVADFFNNKTCAGTDCHEHTFQDYEKGIHGRIRFENREKYAGCIDCHDPHTVRVAEGKKSDSERKPVSDICRSTHTEAQPVGCQSNAECLDCHTLPAERVTAVEKESTLCFHCHGQSSEFAKLAEFDFIPRIDARSYQTTEHAHNRCTDCHTLSATYGHEKTPQNCRNCHTPHNESETHDAHVGVECKACHLQGNAAVNSEMDLIIWQSESARPDP
ncbi:cytochrome c3 family protein, partial [bacterium]|nr:cytochrome c3 family protein [bacterium]